MGKTRIMASKAISIELGREDQAHLEQQVGSGRYDNASDVVSDALQLMRQRDAMFDEYLRQDVRASLADKTPPSPIDDVFKRVRAKVNRAVA